MLERVFLSYSLEDEAWVRNLHSDLLRRLRQPRTSNLVYFAPASNRHGSEWEKVLWNALDQSPVFLPIVSRFSTASGWVKREVERAVALKRQDDCRLIIPLMLTPDVGCLSALHPELERFHFISFFPTYDADRYRKMVSTLVHDLKHLDRIRCGTPVDQRPPIQPGDVVTLARNVLGRW